jgi:glucuronate isomerase
MLKQLGPDTGWDSIGDFSQAKALSKFLNRLDTNNKLAKQLFTISIQPIMNFSQR